jgi:NhaA family Na+:H+ antiporter
MPLFGLASAGVALEGGISAIVQPLPLGVLAGLFVGKQLGVFGAIWLAVKAHICVTPPGARWLQLYGASLLCGIGFTMSLFIGELAFPKSPAEAEAAKLGILAGSLLSALAGWTVLRFSAPVDSSVAERDEAEELFAGDEEN